jgi:hypothetical protein
MKAIVYDYGELSITPLIRLWLCDNYLLLYVYVTIIYLSIYITILDIKLISMANYEKLAYYILSK